MNWLLDILTQIKTFGIICFCFALIGAINIFYEIRRHRAAIAEDKWGKVFLDIWLAQDKDVQFTAVYGKLVNVGKKVIPLTHVLLQIENLKGRWCFTCQSGCEAIPDSANVTVPLTGYCCLLTYGYFTHTLHEADHVSCDCSVTDILAIAKEKSLRRPIQCRAVFVTATRQTYKTKWLALP